MKKFFYYALAAMMAMTMTACGDDKDDNGGKDETSAYVEPQYKDDACSLIPSTPIDLGDGYSLKKVLITESGKAYFEIGHEGDEADTWIHEKVIINGDIYSINGNQVKGTIEVLATRATQKVNMKVKLTITLAQGLSFTIDTDITGLIEAVKTTTTLSGDKDIYSSWKVLGMVLDLEGDVNCYKEFNGGKLAEIRDEAIKQGAELTEQEKKDFSKTVTYITISGGFITIDYSDGTCEKGDWSWVNTQYTQMVLKLEKDHANKFIVNNAKIDVEKIAKLGRYNITLNADISGNKNYKAKLTFRLQQAPKAE